MCNPKQVKLTNYDFHTETKGDKFHLIQNLIVKVEDKLVKDFGYYCEEKQTGRILSQQRGVMRTNCLDCLDRTNVVQSKMLLKIVELILDQLKQLNRKSSKNPQSQA